MSFKFHFRLRESCQWPDDAILFHDAKGRESCQDAGESKWKEKRRRKQGNGVIYWPVGRCAMSVCRVSLFD